MIEAKPSLIFVFHGNSSALEVNFDEPIALEEKLEYGIGLTNFETYYSVANIIDGKNNTIKIANRLIKIPTGTYEIESIEKYLQDDSYENQAIQIKPNLNTLKCQMSCTDQIDLSAHDSIAPILGFEHKIYKAGELHISTKPINILPISACFVECSISTGSYNNGKPGHSIFTFFPNVGVGSKISITPQNVLYLPVTVNTIRSITVKVVDQNGSLIDFQGETITIALHLKPM